MKKQSSESTIYNSKKIEKSFFGRTFVNYLRPTFYVKSIDDMDLYDLKSNGIRALICDLDNTLTPHYMGIPKKKVIDFIRDCNKNEIKFFLVSNNSKKRVKTYYERLVKFDLEISGLIWSAKKPITKKITKLIEKNKLNKNETMMIGDQLEMDILAANVLHIQSILVEPVIESGFNFNFLTKIIEKLIYKKLARFNSINKGVYDKIDFKKYEIL